MISVSMKSQIVLLITDLVIQKIPRKSTNMYSNLILYLFNLKANTNPHEFLKKFLQRIDINELLQKLIELSLIRGSRFRKEIPDKFALTGLIQHDPSMTQCICEMLGQKSSQMCCDCSPLGDEEGTIFTCRVSH